MSSSDRSSSPCEGGRRIGTPISHHMQYNLAGPITPQTPSTGRCREALFTSPPQTFHYDNPFESSLELLSATPNYDDLSYQNLSAESSVRCAKNRGRQLQPWTPYDTPRPSPRRRLSHTDFSNASSPSPQRGFVSSSTVPNLFSESYNSSDMDTVRKKSDIWPSPKRPGRQMQLSSSGGSSGGSSCCSSPTPNSLSLHYSRSPQTDDYYASVGSSCTSGRGCGSSINSSTPAGSPIVTSTPRFPVHQGPPTSCPMQCCRCPTNNTTNSHSSSQTCPESPYNRTRRNSFYDATYMGSNDSSYGSWPSSQSSSYPSDNACLSDRSASCGSPCWSSPGHADSWSNPQQAHHRSSDFTSHSSCPSDNTRSLSPSPRGRNFEQDFQYSSPERSGSCGASPSFSSPQQVYSGSSYHSSPNSSCQSDYAISPYPPPRRSNFDQELQFSSPDRSGSRLSDSLRSSGSRRSPGSPVTPECDFWPEVITNPFDYRRACAYTEGKNIYPYDPYDIYNLRSPITTPALDRARGRLDFSSPVEHEGCTRF